MKTLKGDDLETLAQCQCALGHIAANQIKRYMTQVQIKTQEAHHARHLQEVAERQVRDQAREISRLHRLIAELKSRGAA